MSLLRYYYSHQYPTIVGQQWHADDRAAIAEADDAAASSGLDYYTVASNSAQDAGVPDDHSDFGDILDLEEYIVQDLDAETGHVLESVELPSPRGEKDDDDDNGVQQGRLDMSDEDMCLFYDPAGAFEMPSPPRGDTADDGERAGR